MNGSALLESEIDEIFINYNDEDKIDFLEFTQAVTEK